MNKCDEIVEESFRIQREKNTLIIRALNLKRMNDRLKEPNIVRSGFLNFNKKYLCPECGELLHVEKWVFGNDTELNYMIGKCGYDYAFGDYYGDW